MKLLKGSEIQLSKGKIISFGRRTDETFQEDPRSVATARSEEGAQALTPRLL
jgi:hypothetical protein